jgi:RNA polymerase sigma-70 factor (ECF subfamily)
MMRMFPVREEGSADERYHQDLATVRERVLGYVLRRLVPDRADFGEAEDIAQSCVIALWEQYREKRELAEMLRIAVGVARHKMAQLQRDRGKAPDISDAAADRMESRFGSNPHSGDRVAREEANRLLLAMVKLPVRCREVLRLKLIEQMSYEEIRGTTGIAGNIYEVARRCLASLLRNVGGNSR